MDEETVLAAWKLLYITKEERLTEFVAPHTALRLAYFVARTQQIKCEQERQQAYANPDDRARFSQTLTLISVAAKHVGYIEMYRQVGRELETRIRHAMLDGQSLGNAQSSYCQHLMRWLNNKRASMRALVGLLLFRARWPRDVVLLLVREHVMRNVRDEMLAVEDPFSK